MAKVTYVLAQGRIVRENRKLISESTFPANHVYECHPAFGSIGDVGKEKRYQYSEYSGGGTRCAVGEAGEIERAG